jgi:TRAP-type uncharacterized transport system fused permease subunit
LYVDPGSGSYLVQVIIAAILGALFYFKHLWWQVKAFFSRSKKEEPPTNETPNE